MLHGFDVSAFQGNTVPACDFVFVKATEGKSYTSSKFNAQWASAKTHAKVVGAYHFARPEESSGASQADRLIARAKAAPGEMLCLDLEASKLTQAQTNAWAKAFGDRLREKAPGVTTVLYLGSGYATNGTGKGLADHFDWWWYPQYPSAYQLVDDLDIELHLAQKRSSLHPERMPIAASATAWPSSVSPWLPSGTTTGWAKPHLWQFTDNFGGLDASITALTLKQLAGGGQQPTPQEDDDPMVPGNFRLTADDPKYPILFDHGKFKSIWFWLDNSYASDTTGIKAAPQQSLRVAVLDTTGKTMQTEDFLVGRGPKDAVTKPMWVNFKIPASANALAISQGSKGPCDQRIAFVLI